MIHVCLGGLLYGLASGCIPHAHQSLSDVTSQWVAVTQSQQHNNMVSVNRAYECKHLCVTCTGDSQFVCVGW